MKKSIIISLFLFIMLLIFSCKENSTSIEVIPENTDELVPLKIGNYWLYEVTTNFGRSEHIAQLSLTVDSEIQYQNEKHFLIKGQDPITKETLIPNAYFINKSDGHYIINFEANDSTEIIKFNYPTFAGDTIYSDEYSKYYIEKIDDYYTTPAGKFKCIKFVYILYLDGREIDRYINYKSPGIGTIAEVTYSTNSISGIKRLTYKSVLQSYKLY